MSVLRDAIDYTTLGWIKPELDETLRQARMAIEAFAEDPGDDSQIRLCVDSLHQVQGTLRMVELYAPAMVAEEMEQLARALQAGTVPVQEEACATLMRGVVLLPDYLERLQGGHKDIPIVLLPLLNELRAARGETGLSESVLFAPDLQRPLPDAVASSSADRGNSSRAVRETLAAPLLLQLRNALSSWPEDGAPDSASALATALDGLLGQTTGESDRRMLWVASSVASALADGALPPTPTLRQAFASVERETRRLFEDDGFGLPRADAPLEPTRQLLYHVAHATGTHAGLQRLRDTFDLDARGPTASELEHARGSLTGRNRALLDTVSAAIKEDLLRVKDVLDLYLRSGHSDIEGLQPQVEALGRVADTLGMLGLGMARKVIQDQRDAVRAMVHGERPADEGALLDIAGALLYVDASLDEQVAHLGGPDTGADESMLASESRKVLEVVVREAIANFADARQAFVAFVETSWDHAELAEVPRLLDEVSGALRMLELKLPADYLTGVRLYAERELIGRHRVPNGRQLDTLADALASLEYYLEALREQRANRDDILDIARNSLESLAYWPLPTGDVTPTVAGPAVAAPGAEDVNVDVDVPDFSEQAAGGLSNIASPQPIEPLAPVTAAATTPAVATTAASAPVGAGGGGFEVTGDEIDDEIREVFLEEFEEEIDNLDKMLPAWRAAPDDMERLRPIRRVFHTLKGSGRLVGAKTLGEFSWKVETMLNRVLDGSRPPSPAVIAMVDQAFYTLPQLQAALRGETAIDADLEGMQALADRIAAGEDVFYAAPDAASIVEATPDATVGATVGAAEIEAVAPVVEPVTDTVPASIDPVLLEILDTEVTGHLGTVERWITAAQAAPAIADDLLLRSIHTMNGAFAMTEVPSITDAMTPAEAYVKRLLVARAVATAAGIQAISELAAAARATVAALHAPAPRVPRYTLLAARLAALRDSLPEASLQDMALSDSAIGGAHARMVPAGTSAEEISAFDLSAYGDLEVAAADDVQTGSVEPLLGEPLVATLDVSEPQSAEAAAGLEVLQAVGDAERVEVDAAATGQVDEAVVAETPALDSDEATRLEAARIEEEERLEYERLELEYAEQARQTHERAEAERVAAEAQAAATELDDAASAEVERGRAVERLLAQALVSAEDPDETLDLTDLDEELVDIFIEESVDLLDHSDGLLAQLRDAPSEREPLIGLQRDLHTIKGGARMAGIMAVGELGHVMESLLEAVVEHRSELGRDGIPLLERGFDRLHGMLTRVAERRAIGLPVQLIAEFEDRVRGRARPPSEREGLATPVPAPRVEHLKSLDLKPLSAPISDERSLDDDDIGVRAPQEQVRIRADLLDRLVNYAGEVAIYRARLEQQLGAFRGAMVEMEQTNLRLRDQLRRLDSETEAQIIARYQRENENADETFDPLELDRFSTLQQLSRGLAESAADLTSLQGSMDDLTRQYETLLLQQSRVSSELQEGLMRTRMVPFDGLVPRLRRVLRQAATDTGKQVQLKLEGAQGELDRNVLERMTAPLEHMLRNAVAHGLESPEQRRKAGKPEEGIVRIVVRREGSEVVLEVGDDGAGLNRQAIHKRAVERGLIRSDARMADGDLDMLIFEPGFSTADEVSRLAGRGVGMDVVASEVRQLGGALDIHSKAGEGTNFVLRLPQTLAVTQAVFVRIGDTSFAVPIASVRGVGRIARDQLGTPGAVYPYGGEDYVLHDLGSLLGHAPAKAEGQLQMPLLLVRSGDLRAAVTIDQVIGNREIVVKPVGPQVASVPGIFGATIMGDGGVVVILDVAPLVRRQAALPRDVAPAPVVEARKIPLVMVVDDSVTMRKVTGRVLERNNFEVGTAKDGIDALERMADRVPDLMLLDIEMPRMDGYELATQMKADPRLRDVPIIMITSRTGEKHRQRAFEIGVQRYLGKPYQEHELLRNVFELLEQEQEQANREPAGREPA
ncbi:hybrid sensor histidine kinase/response regulator [Cognatiluteimonas profundi]|uniref:hybrid sensor histidine kinase/response regulator n=1 Tax=Cognatiluteimonas profundi TaxID=2594501 RepID=UPI00131BD250|nr:hybrid sensor histidine kinase/response regulator [Lysobacter profundi]